jgi:hypothetical protein
MARSTCTSGCAAARIAEPAAKPSGRLDVGASVPGARRMRALGGRRCPVLPLKVTTRCLSAVASPHQRRARVVYVTDCEGNLDYLLQCIDLAAAATAEDCAIRIARRDPVGSPRPALLELADDTHFVFGGDVVDHGGADLRVLSTLIGFKRRYPNNVHFILGNRDINKMRLSSELDASDLRRDPTLIPPPYWQHPRQRLPLVQFLDNVASSVPCPWDMASNSIRFVPKSQRPKPPPLGGSNMPDRQTLQLRWILRHTMGSPNAFELRRRELQLMGDGASSGGDVSDADVVASFRDSVGSNGLLREYIGHGRLALILGNTLFVHGAVCERSAGFVPGDGDPAENVDAALGASTGGGPRE